MPGIRRNITEACRSFAAIWNNSATLREVAERLGRPKDSCRTEATRMRSLGLAMKRMPRECKSAPEEERFWLYVEKTDNCWTWTGATNKDGYGQINSRNATRRILAHRLSWMIHFGGIPSGLFVCHACDNPPCVRPDHLFVGTAMDNMRDMIKKGRAKGPEKLTPKDVAEFQRLRRDGYSYQAIANMTNFSIAWVWKCLQQK